MNSIVSSQLLSQLSDWIADRIGLHFPLERWSDLQRNIVAAAQELEYPNPESTFTDYYRNPSAGP